MKVYVKCSKKSNLELLKSFVGKDEWVLVNITNLYSGKVIKKGLMKVNKIRGNVYYNMIPLSFSSRYPNALDYVIDYHVSIDNVLNHSESCLKDCVQVIEPVQSYTTAQIMKAIDET